MRELNRVHLNGLRALEAAGRRGSLQGAADELGVTIGAVSQQIIKAETQLGRAVFMRTAKGLRPTRFGETFLAQLGAGFRALDEAVGSARLRPGNSLIVSVAPVLASKWLVPRLGRFSKAHPGIRVTIDARSELVDPNTGEINLAIRVGDGRWRGVEKEFLLPQEVFPVCAPALAGLLRKPADLLSVPVVRDVNSVLRWQLWLDAYGLEEISMREGNGFTDAAMALDAAIAGQGVMLAWQTLAHDAIAAGVLATPFAHRAPSGLGYWLVSAKGRSLDPHEKAFAQWLKAEMAQTAVLFEPARNAM
jgi:LysR family transcriptional regulator, glycine cleavage system transcriptional activator